MSIKKRISIWIVLLLLLPCVAIGASASSSSQEIKVGYVSNYGVLKATFAEGSEGYGYEYLTSLIPYMDGDYTFKFVSCTSWQDGLDKLESGEIDLLGPTTKEEETQYIYTTNDFGHCTFMLATLSGDSDVQVNAISLDGAVIGVPDYYQDAPYLTDFLQTEGVEATIVSVPSQDINLALGLEEVDYIWMSSLQTQAGLTIVAGLDSYDVYFIASAENQALIDEIDTALEALEQAEPYFQTQLALEYSSYNYTTNAYISEESYALVQEQGVYRVGIRNFYSPLIREGSDGTLEGAGFVMLDLLAEQAGISFEYVLLDEEATQEEFDSTDFLIVATDLTQALGFPYNSSTYLELPFILLEHREISTQEIASQRIGVAEYYRTDSLLVDDTLYGREVVKYITVQELQQAFDAGEIDCMLITVVSLNMVRDDFETEDYIATTVGDSLQLSLAFSENMSNQEITVFNKLIATLDQSVLDAAVLEYTVAEQEVSLRAVLQDKPYFVINAVIIVILIIAATSMFFLQRRRKEIITAMNVDRVTGMMTEHKFIEEARKLLQEDKEGRYRLVVMDIDQFKLINELYGYDVGSALLNRLGQIMQRRADKYTLVARGTADHFMTLAPMVDTVQAEEWIAADIQDLHAALQQLIGTEYKLYFSVGIYEVDNRAHDISTMLNYADMARQQGKQRAGTAVCVFNQQMRQEMKQNNYFTSIMKQSLEDEEFLLYYQPKVSLSTGELEGAEALVRWQRADAFLPPYQFIPLFEKNGFIEEVDYYVLAKACAFMRAHPAIMRGRMSVNLSGVTMLQEDVVQKVVDVVKGQGIDPAQIDLEITETAFVDTGAVLEKAHVLREHGFTISMDDFGAGVSSLNRLKNIYVDTLKIDREFIIDSLENERCNAILQRVLDMAKDLKIATVAEGVETAEQGALLQRLGCQTGQGYFYARPMTEAQFVAYCQEHSVKDTQS